MGILELCNQEPAAVRPESSVAECIELMLAKDVGAVAVVDASSVVGIFTERDVLKKLALSRRDPATIKVSEFMTSPVETARPDTSPGDAFATMMDRYIRHLPIVDHAGKLLAILSLRDLLHAEVEELRRELNSMEQYVSNDSLGG